MPLDSVAVIPEGWSAHHAPIARSGMTARVTVGSPGGPAVWDPFWEEMVPGPAVVVYDDVARIQRLSGAQDVDSAGEAVTQRSYLVAIDYAAPRVEIGWVVRVTECANDADLVGRVLYIEDFYHGSERWQRDLVCSFRP